jgi:hypothetical protein
MFVVLFIVLIGATVVALDRINKKNSAGDYIKSGGLIGLGFLISLALMVISVFVIGSMNIVFGESELPEDLFFLFFLLVLPVLLYLGLKKLFKSRRNEP